MAEPIDVLIVEDDPMVAAVHRQFIAEIPGFVVAGVVSGGREALEFLSRHKVRLVILDIFMPGMDGVTTLQKIRETNGTVGVIVVSASRDTNTVNAVLKAGAFDYIIKPFVFERIQTSLRAFEQLETRLNRGAAQIDQDRHERIDERIVFFLLLFDGRSEKPEGERQLFEDLGRDDERVARGLRFGAGLRFERV